MDELSVHERLHEAGHGVGGPRVRAALAEPAHPRRPNPGGRWWPCRRIWPSSREHPSPRPATRLRDGRGPRTGARGHATRRWTPEAAARPTSPWWSRWGGFCELTATLNETSSTGYRSRCAPRKHPGCKVRAIIGDRNARARPRLRQPWGCVTGSPKRRGRRAAGVGRGHARSTWTSGSPRWARVGPPLLLCSAGGGKFGNRRAGWGTEEAGRGGRGGPPDLPWRDGGAGRRSAPIPAPATEG